MQLNSYLTQTISVGTVRTTYMNKPFTSCINIDGMKNNTQNLFDDIEYHEDYCVMVEFIEESCSEVEKKIRGNQLFSRSILLLMSMGFDAIIIQPTHEER